MVFFTRLKTKTVRLVLILTLMSALLSILLLAVPLAQDLRPSRPLDGIQEDSFLLLHSEPVELESRLPPKEDANATGLTDWSNVVFQSYRDSNWEIYQAKGDGSSQIRLTNHSGSDIHPRLDRGCTRIAFASSRAGNYEIYTMQINGSGLTQLTANSADDVNPAWSPDSTKIAFQSYRNGQAEIYVMNANGSNQTQLTSNGAYDGDPTWSPDGSKIAFVSDRTGGYHIWVMNADGSGQAQLSNQAYSENPTWSPDGTKIAYDSDGDGDWWLELWLMNADGSGEHEVYDPGGAHDAWARSWSPNGQYIAFTHLSFVYYQGDWWWTTAYLEKYDVNNGSTSRLSSQGTDWKPDWQTCDVQSPTSKVQVLPTESPGPIAVSWSGSDVGSAGIKDYDVQVKDGPGEVWTDWLVGTAATVASYPGEGGYTYYFRTRARDNAHNLEDWPADYDASTTVEALPPETVVNTLPDYSRDSVTVSWIGSDPGGSGIQSYEVQYRNGVGESWNDWQVGTTSTSAAFSGTAGHTYHFRVRGTDRAQNVEDWPTGDGDTRTTFYAWGITGTVRDNAGAPVAGAIITTTPEALAVIPSDIAGNIAAYVVISTSTYMATWGKSGYGSLPATHFDAPQNGYLDVVLPPADNVVHNWGFEAASGSLLDWDIGGEITPTVTAGTLHTGEAGVLLGQETGRDLNPPEIIWGGEWSYPDIAVDQQGMVHVAYLENDISYAYRTTDGQWVGPVSVGSIGQWHHPSRARARIAVVPSGVAHVVWEGEAGIYYSHSLPDGSWTEQIVIGPDGGGHSDYCIEADIAADSQGSLHVVYRCWTSWKRHLHYRYRSPSGTWTDPERIGSGRSPGITVGPDDVVHVWHGGTYRQRSPGGEWSPEEPIPAGCRIVVGLDGTLHAVCDGGYYANKPPGSTWSSLTGLDKYYWGNLAVDSKGTVYVVSISAAKQAKKNFRYRPANGEWTEPEVINGNPSGQPDIVVDHSDNVHLVYEGAQLANHYQNNRALSEASSAISQTVTIQSGPNSPILSFLYKLDGVGARNPEALEVLIVDSLTSTVVFSTTENRDWAHTWVDMTPWAGQTATLAISLHQIAGYPRPWAYLDEVSIGSAYPDLWVSKKGSSVDVLPEGQVLYTITYGNQGGAAASSVLIEDTWPRELVLVDAAPSPTISTSSSLAWDIGSLSAKSGPLTISITATATSTATMWNTFINTATISTTTSELETANNLAQTLTFIGRHVFMPLVLKEYYD